MEQGPTRKEHYIPRFYLKSFSADDKSVYGYNVLSGEQKILGINKICYENDLYEFKENSGEYINQNLIENWFRFFEEEFSKVFKSIFSKAQYKANYNTNSFLSPKEKALLTFFMVTIIGRNPDTLKIAQETVIDLLGDSITDISAKNIALQKCLPIYQEFNPEDKNLIMKFMKIFEDMSFQIGFSDKELLWTSDSPVVLFGNNETLKLDEAILPISPQLILYMKPYEKTTKERYNHLLKLNSADKTFFNRDIVTHCKQWIYSKSPLTEKQIIWINKERSKLWAISI